MQDETNEQKHNRMIVEVNEREVRETLESNALSEKADRAIPPDLAGFSEWLRDQIRWLNCDGRRATWEKLGFVGDGMRPAKHYAQPARKAAMIAEKLTIAIVGFSLDVPEEMTWLDLAKFYRMLLVKAEAKENAASQGVAAVEGDKLASGAAESKTPTAKEAADTLKLSISHVYRLLRSSKLVLTEQGIEAYRREHSKPANKRKANKGRRNTARFIKSLG